MLLTEIATLDEVLQAHAEALGGDFTAYRNHTYRVANLCAALSSSDPEPLRKIAIAAAFHDLGIWTDGTFDYLQPSIRLASAHLAQSGRAEWTSEVTEMILEHHKISAWRGIPTGSSSLFDRRTGLTSRGGSARSGCRGSSCARSSRHGPTRASTSCSSGSSSSACEPTPGILCR